MLRRRYVYATLLLCFCHVDATLGMGGRGGACQRSSALAPQLDATLMLRLWYVCFCYVDATLGMGGRGGAC